MSNNKMTTCKTCGKEMAKNAKVCPNCGAKNKKPIPWFIAIIVVIVIIAIASGGKSGSKSTTSSKSDSNNSAAESTAAESTTQAIEYTSYTVDDLMAQLNDNALKASDAHKGEYVKITGKLGVIDSSGKYISLLPDTDFAIIGVTCYIKTMKQKQKLLNYLKTQRLHLQEKSLMSEKLWDIC